MNTNQRQLASRIVRIGMIGVAVVVPDFIVPGSINSRFSWRHELLYWKGNDNCHAKPRHENLNQNTA